MKDSVCPLCNYPSEAHEMHCQSCGVDLALATVMVENVLSDFGDEARKRVPVSPEVLVPRIGQYLVEKGLLSEEELHIGLRYQKEQNQAGNPMLVGQALLSLDLVDQSQLDQAITEQILRLQQALSESNQELESRVIDRTKDLQRALNRLTELNQLKSNFIANISHELRTPLTHITGYTELMTDGTLGSVNLQQRQALDVMNRSGRRLEKLINDLIRFSESSQGEVSLTLEPVSLIALIENEVAKAREKAVKKDIAIASRVTSNTPPVLGDEEKIGWVISQLLDNAIKFTPRDGRVMISCEEDGRYVRIRIRDTGIGIPDDQVDEIFEAFHQLDGTTTRKYGGTGLGLALVKRILEAHSTSLLVDSKLDRGSSFHFSLPMILTRANVSPLRGSR